MRRDERARASANRVCVARTHLAIRSARPWAHELPDVVLTGQVSDEQLAAIYTGAHALISPSSNGGFGLPKVLAELSPQQGSWAGLTLGAEYTAMPFSRS